MISSDIKKILFEINLTKSENLNFSYLSRDNINARLGNYEEELPLSPTKSKWQTSDEMLSRTYQIDNRKHFSYFVNNILDHANKLGHDPILKLNYPDIAIKLQTHNVGEVTEIDIEYSKFIDEVYEDIMFLLEEF